MNWFGWTFTIFNAVGALMYVWQIGKARKPVTALDAILTLIFTALLIVGAATVGTLS